MNRRRISATQCWLATTLLLAGMSWPAKSVQAATTCSVVSTEPLAFGTVTGQLNEDTVGEIVVHCNTRISLGVLGGRTAVNMCLSFGDGSGGTGVGGRRLMAGNPNYTMEFQIYQDPAMALVWGDPLTPGRQNPLQRTWSYPLILLSGSGESNVPVYGQVFQQRGLAPGSYSASFNGTAHARLDYTYNEPLLVLSPPPPASCTQGGDGRNSVSFQFGASAVVEKSCTIRATADLDFGTVPGLIDSVIDQATTVTLDCTAGTAWQIGLDNGQNAAGDTRRMLLEGGNSHVVYGLYRDPARTQRWGAVPGAEAETGVGTGYEQTVTVHGRVPAGQAVPAGQYRDTVTVTVTY